MGLTKKVLKRPVTTVLVVLCLIVFGLSSIFSSQLELIPEMEMPMLIISAGNTTCSTPLTWALV